MNRGRRNRGDQHGLALLLLGGLLLAAGCDASSTATDTTHATDTATSAEPAPPASPSLGSARAGSLRISGAYVPQPASPDVAAAYFTVTNTGGTADALVAVSSDVGTTSLHRTVGGAMVALDELTVPAHGTAALAPGGNHLMIEAPTRPIAVGSSVRLTLTFTHAGVVTVAAPVTGYGGASSPGAMPGMSGMPGMSATSGSSP